MARITICDLCKERIRDDESKQGELTLSFYVQKGEEDKGLMNDHEELCAELCLKCTTLLRITIEGEVPMRSPESPQKNRSGDATTPSDTKTTVSYAPPGKAVGPSEKDKATREPTKELLDDEMVKVRSRFDKHKASKIIREQKGPCDHHFKSFHDGKIICGDAPQGIKGDLASFRGCGKTLTKAEY